MFTSPLGHAHEHLDAAHDAYSVRMRSLEHSTIMYIEDAVLVENIVRIQIAPSVLSTPFKMSLRRTVECSMVSHWETAHGKNGLRNRERAIGSLSGVHELSCGVHELSCKVHELG